jgi:type IV pilus assembly protein PilX
MILPHKSPPSDQHGVVLVSSLLLLLVVTIMALSMFRSFGMQERIAGNVREKQRALQAATSTQLYAEWWLVNSSSVPLAVSSGVASSVDVVCNAVVDANAGNGQVCGNTMASAGLTVTAPPWTAASVTYTPPQMNINGVASATTCANNDCYYAKPAFYITDLGLLPNGQGEAYKVDAYSYGLSANAIAVVESTVAVGCLVCNPGGL